MASPYWHSHQLPGGQYPPSYPPQPYPSQAYPSYFQAAPANPHYYPAGTYLNPYPQTTTHQPWPQAPQTLWQQSRPSQYPLHFLLAADVTHVRFSLRRDVRTAVPHEAFPYAHQPATSKAAPKMRLLCRDFPWIIDIEPRTGYTFVAIGDVWEGLHKALQEPLTASEWAMAGADHQKVIGEAMQKRISKGDPVKHAKRLDMVGKMRVFMGLAKDDAVLKKPLLPGTEEVEETWVVILGP